MVECAVCGKRLAEKEGMVSSTGVVVCSDVCKTGYMDTLPGKGRSPLVVYSRVTGYYTPVSAWNKGKQREHKDRVHYSLSRVMAE